MKPLGGELVGVTFKVPIEDKQAWQEEAREARMGLSAWIRESCQMRMGRSFRPVPEDTFIPLPRADIPATALAADMLGQAVAKAKPCERRMPKGTYCKRCGRTH